MIDHLGYRIDPDAGLIYGLRGRPVGSADSTGYLQVDGRTRGLGMLSAHRLIWEAANGPIPSGLEINHRNGIKTDNRIANLELVTHQENILHAYATGLKTNRGEAGPRSILTESDVRRVRQLAATGLPSKVIAAEFGVASRTIRDAVAGRSWSHLAQTGA